MGLQLVLLVLALVAIGLVVAALLSRRRGPPAPQGRPATEAMIDMETEDRDGTTVAELADAPEPRRRPRIPLAGAIAALVVVALAAAALLIYGQTSARGADRFVVLVAPFDDGGDGQTGRNVADALARQIADEVRGPVTVSVLGERPADEEQALRVAADERSDLLIWGGVEPGAMLDSQSLRPRLVYTPNGAYAPNGWDGYLGRFAMPRSYTLASEPINGQAVLPDLVGALFAYGQGQADQAEAAIGGLLGSYPAIDGPLPRAIRGNVLWARGNYGDAAGEYRAALASTATPSGDLALLANNLGAILLDDGSDEVLGAFSEAVRLLDGRDLGELRYNLGLLALRDQRPADAAVELEQARNLLPASTPLLLSLAEAYRESGRLGNAQTALEQAVSQAGADQRLTPGDFRGMFRQHLDAGIREQRSLLGLSRNLAAAGPLTWELEIAPPQPEDEIAELRNQLRSAVELSEQEAGRWHQRSASESAANPDTGQLAAGQAERAESDARRQRYELALLETEVARARRGRPASAINRTWGAFFGGPTPVASSLTLLGELEQRDPDNPAILMATARALRVDGQLNEADRVYDRLIQVASQRPEGYFGKGVIAVDRGDSATAEQLLRIAVDRNGAFFPARFELARLAQARGDLAEAINQLRAVGQLRPGPDAAVALAQSLRASGPSGYPEAEQVLLAYSLTDAGAAIELGRLYNDAGRAAESIQEYRRALALDPRSSTASFELGERLVAAGDLEGAEKALRDALRFDERNTAARLTLARLYEGPLNRPDRADREYGVALSQGVSDLNALLAIGDTALQNENPGQAISAYTKAAQLQPTNPLPHYRLSLAYLATNRLQSANDSAQQALSLTASPGDDAARELRAQAFIVVGDVARRRGDLALASDSYIQAQQIAPQLIAVQIGLGQVAVGQGQWGVALGYFEAAAGLPGGAESADAQFWLAEGLLRNGSLDRAAASYARALELRPQFPEALLGLAQAQEARGSPDEALATVEQSLDARPGYAEALLFKGKLLQTQGRTAEARSAYDASIRSSNRIAETFYRRGLLLLRDEQYDAAVSDMRRAIQLQPNFPDANYWLGRAYYAQGRLQSAHDAFRRAVDLSAGYTEAMYYLGLAAEDLGSRDEAIGAYQTVILADADGEWGARAREQLERIQ